MIVFQILVKFRVKKTSGLATLTKKNTPHINVNELNLSSKIFIHIYYNFNLKT